MDSELPTQADKFLFGGDLNLYGGSPESFEMACILECPSLCAPDFPTTSHPPFFQAWRH